MDRPMFDHDCDSCIFLGHYDGHDLYHHKEGMETFVARYGNDGPEYKSGKVFSYGMDEHLTKARELTIN